MTEPTIDEAATFHHGLKLFNEGDWFEAHEVWEDVWREAGGEKKLFYQGIIQCAVTIEHMRRGNPRGVVNVYETSLTKFVGLPDVYMGIDHKKLTAEIGEMVDAVRAMPAEYFSPRAGRGLDMPVDLENAPRIELQYDPFAEESE